MEPLKHECGIAMVRLFQPLKYYQEKYGTWTTGLDELYLLMEKQHNRGQEGAGIACIKMDAAPGQDYMFRERAMGSGAITEIFDTVRKDISNHAAENIQDIDYVNEHISFAGQMYMGHLRYSTSGRKGLQYVHPFMRRNNWKARNLCLCGNFNMTNVDEVFQEIVSFGQHPRAYADTYILLEQIGHRLDRESERLFVEAKEKGLQKQEITSYIENNINVANVLRKCAPLWDGGYVICGMTGSGESFVMRDPWGIRPAFWYMNEEQLVVASERPVIQTTLVLDSHEVNELKPGQAIIVNRHGQMHLEQILEPHNYAACAFERIYFSRGNDADIYQERKALGYKLVPSIMKAIDNDINHTVFSFIPNTAESAFYGMLEGFNSELDKLKEQQINQLHLPAERDKLKSILSQRVRCEKIAWKDIKMRTFIAEGNSRNNLANHVYDITYGTVVPGVDNLVIIDDSIVRGTTLRESIIRIMDRLHPKKIVIVSSAPQIRYPDYYGIDMPSLEEFIAFRATIELLKERKMEQLIVDTYNLCKQEVKKYASNKNIVNYVKNIYDPFSAEEISQKMVQMLHSKEVKAEINIVYQSLEGLHEACPNHPGDWYFSGKYPTPGGTRRVNQAFIDFVEQKLKGSLPIELFDALSLEEG